MLNGAKSWFFSFVSNEDKLSSYKQEQEMDMDIRQINIVIKCNTRYSKTMELCTSRRMQDYWKKNEEKR